MNGGSGNTTWGPPVTLQGGHPRKPRQEVGRGAGIAAQPCLWEPTLAGVAPATWGHQSGVTGKARELWCHHRLRPGPVSSDTLNGGPPQGHRGPRGRRRVDGEACGGVPWQNVSPPPAGAAHRVSGELASPRPPQRRDPGWDHPSGCFPERPGGIWGSGGSCWPGGPPTRSARRDA